jgi:hypothetical protein
MSANDLLGGKTEILNFHQVRRIDRHPGKHVENSAPDSISETENWVCMGAD